MTTKFEQPKFDNFRTYDGWIFPDYNERQYPVNGLEQIKWYQTNLNVTNSFEFLQSIFGQYRYYYHLKNENSIMKQCIRNCITADNIQTRNINQGHKLCARECIMTAKEITEAGDSFLERRLAGHYRADAQNTFDSILLSQENNNIV